MSWPPAAAYHCTTEKKLARYIATGAILPPVRFWTSEITARSWMSRVKRSVLLRFPWPEEAYPLPDHKPRGCAYWTPGMVREWRLVSVTEEPME